MDYREAIEYFDKELKRDCMVLSPMLEGKKSVRAQFFETDISAMEELEQYKQLGTLEEVRAAVEKQTAVSRVIIGGKYYCPKCSRNVMEKGYCKCGQKLY